MSKIVDPPAPPEVSNALAAKSSEAHSTRNGLDTVPSLDANSPTPGRKSTWSLKKLIDPSSL